MDSKRERTASEESIMPRIASGCLVALTKNVVDVEGSGAVISAGRRQTFLGACKSFIVFAYWDTRVPLAAVRPLEQAGITGTSHWNQSLVNFRIFL